MANIEIKNVQVKGKERENILTKFKEVLAKWALKMPEIKPLVLDFGLGHFYKEGLIEYWIANEVEEGYCGKFLFVFDGQTCPYHHHIFKHETFFVVKGNVIMNVNGKELIMRAGDIQVMHQNTGHSFTGKGDALLLEVSKPCIPKDSIFRNKLIGESGIV